MSLFRLPPTKMLGSQELRRKRSLHLTRLLRMRFVCSLLTCYFVLLVHCRWTYLQEIFATIRALLNKLTPNNYDKLSAKMMDVPFTTTSERLTGTVDLIFEKVSRMEGSWLIRYSAVVCFSLFIGGFDVVCGWRLVLLHHLEHALCSWWLFYRLRILVLVDV